MTALDLVNLYPFFQSSSSNDAANRLKLLFLLASPPPSLSRLSPAAAPDKMSLLNSSILTLSSRLIRIGTSPHPEYDDDSVATSVPFPLLLLAPLPKIVQLEFRLLSSFDDVTLSGSCRKDCFRWRENHESRSSRDRRRSR